MTNLHSHVLRDLGQDRLFWPVPLLAAVAEASLCFATPSLDAVKF
jgi:hypothetical protein